MKIKSYLTLLFPVILLSSCTWSGKDCAGLIRMAENEITAGNLTNAQLLAGSLKRTCPEDTFLVRIADSLSDIAGRIPLDFSVSGREADSLLKQKTGNFTPEEKELWEKKNWLEWKMINGEKRYFNRAVSNLGLLNNFYFHRSYSDSIDALTPEMEFQKKNIESIIRESGIQGKPVCRKEMTVNYKLTVDPDAVPDGETVRCWLPYPREDNPKQTEVKFISASQEKYQISPDSAVHRTIYMEAKARKGKPLVFSVSFSYKSSGLFSDPGNLKIFSYDKASEIFRKYTAEQPPQIHFSENIRHLADSITGSETRPFEIVRKIYLWFSENIPWAGAQEYSIMSDIPEYVIRNRRGDCGMQTLLFMSMLRYRGIPVKWESGWKVPPAGKNLHDWCEVYFEGTGWVPVDVSYGLQYSGEKKTREFYISGLDSYRFIVNDGISGRLYPEKKFMRSEPYDFQRGEVEWGGGNLYFDKWNYNMEVSYNNEK